MATKQTTTFVDDLDGGEADRTVRFSFDGVDYEIDLAEANAEALNEVLAPFVAVARRVSGSRRAGRGAARSTRPGSSRPAVKKTAVDAKAPKTPRGSSNVAEIRAWASEHGFTVGDRGRIPDAVKKAWAEATGK